MTESHHNVVNAIVRAKKSLAARGIKGKTLESMLVEVFSRLDRLDRLESERERVKAVLRAHGAQPNGKRLDDAVDEAMRKALE